MGKQIKFFDKHGWWFIIMVNLIFFLGLILVGSLASAQAPNLLDGTQGLPSLDTASLSNNTYYVNYSVTAGLINSSYLLRTGDTATGNYTFDTNTLFIDATNDRVGIGTTVPGVWKLKINVGTDQNIGFRSFGGVSQIESVNDAGTVDKPLRIDANGALLSVGGTSGNVGIGTTSPSSLLNLNSSGVDADALTVQDNARKIKIGRDQIEVTDLSDVVQDLYINPTGDVLLSSTSGNVGIGTTGPGAKLDVNGTSVFRGHMTFSPDNTYLIGADGANRPYGLRVTTDIDVGSVIHLGASGVSYLNGGNVGIGTTSPDSLLEVNGSVKFTNAVDNTASLVWSPTAEGNAGSLTAGHYFSSSGYKSTSNVDLILQQHGTAQNIKFNIGGANTKMVLDSSGNVGIGTTSPQAKLHVNGSAVFNGTITTDANRIINIGNGTAAQDAVTLSQLQSVNVSATAAETDPIWTANYSARTGTGNVVFSTSPTITSPTISTSIILPPSQINTTHILDGTILTADIANAQITADKIAASAVNTTHILDGTILPQDFNAAVNTSFDSRYLLNTGDTATGNYTFNTNLLFIDATNNRVGIGATDPQLKLHIDGVQGAPQTTGILTNGSIFIGNSLNNNGIAIGNYNTPFASWIQSMNWGDASVNYNLVLQPNGGNVGIGTVSPQNKLNIIGAVNATQFIVNASVGYSGSCVNTTYLGGIAVGCND